MHISVKCSVALHCLIFISEYGEQGRVTSQLLAKSTGVNPVTIRTILSALKKAGIVEVRPGTGGATLALPPEQIDVFTVTKALEPDFLSKLIGVHASPSDLCPVGRNIHEVLDDTYETVREDLCHSLKGITLADVLARYQETLVQEAQGERDGSSAEAGSCVSSDVGDMSATV